MNIKRQEYERERLAKYGGHLEVERTGICDTCGSRSSGTQCNTFTLTNPDMCRGKITRNFRYEKSVSVAGYVWPGKWFPDHAEALAELHALAKATKERQTRKVEGWWEKQREERIAARRARGEVT
tara:strand:+ start:3869 stop:4243 length:375 start_codon:yes stop_codon:yes gene_type:complete